MWVLKAIVHNAQYITVSLFLYFFMSYIIKLNTCEHNIIGPTQCVWLITGTDIISKNTTADSGWEFLFSLNNFSFNWVTNFVGLLQKIYIIKCNVMKLKPNKERIPSSVLKIKKTSLEIKSLINWLTKKVFNINKK